MIWSVGGQHKVLVRLWPDHCVAFHTFSGNTHFLDFVAASILTELSSVDLSTDALCAKVAKLLDLDNDAVVAERVDELLVQLEDLGLVEPAPSC